MDEKIRALFPLKGEITQEIIDTADVWFPRECIGALTLKAALEEKLKEEDFSTSWGSIIGHPTIYKEEVILTTQERVDMMEVKKPQTVTFILNID